MTKTEVILALQDKINNIQEEGTEDTAAWEYCAELEDAIDAIRKGAEISDIIEEHLS